MRRSGRVRLRRERVRLWRAAGWGSVALSSPFRISSEPRPERRLVGLVHGAARRQPRPQEGRQRVPRRDRSVEATRSGLGTRASPTEQGPCESYADRSAGAARAEASIRREGTGIPKTKAGPVCAGLRVAGWRVRSVGLQLGGRQGPTPGQAHVGHCDVEDPGQEGSCCTLGIVAAVAWRDAPSLAVHRDWQGDWKRRKTSRSLPNNAVRSLSLGV